RFASDAVVDLPAIARTVIAEAGYIEGDFNARNCSILTTLSEIPKDQRIPPQATLDDDAIERAAANDQANVFGYACRETPELMPLPISLAHRLARALDEAHRGGLRGLSSDGKTQVAVEYRNRQPLRINSISLTAAIREDAVVRHIEDHLRAL